jgi:hypothetical protein
VAEWTAVKGSRTAVISSSSFMMGLDVAVVQDDVAGGFALLGDGPD